MLNAFNEAGLGERHFIGSYGYGHGDIGKENIEKVEFEFNGKKYLMTTNTFGETKTVHYKLKLVEGTNYLTIKNNYHHS